MVKSCTIIFGSLAVGEIIVRLTHISLPSSIVGMLLLTLLLQIGVVRLEWVKSLADFLLSNLAFFFVPPGVALMLYLDLISAEFVPIAVATIVSTIVVLVVTAWTHQLVRQGQRRRQKAKKQRAASIAPLRSDQD